MSIDEFRQISDNMEVPINPHAVLVFREILMGLSFNRSARPARGSAIFFSLTCLPSFWDFVWIVGKTDVVYVFGRYLRCQDNIKVVENRGIDNNFLVHHTLISRVCHDEGNLSTNALMKHIVDSQNTASIVSLGISLFSLSLKFPIEFEGSVKKNDNSQLDPKGGSTAG